MTFEEALAQIEDPQQVPQSSRHALLLPLRTLQKAPPGAGQCRFANETYQYDAAPRSAHGGYILLSILPPPTLAGFNPPLAGFEFGSGRIST
jgi:hypothetical protein